MQIISDLKHYFGVCLVLIVLLVGGYFVGSHLIAEYKDHGVATNGPVAVVTQPTPSSVSEHVADVIAQALKDKALADAVAGRAADLSTAQQTVANAVSTLTGINSRLAGAVTLGLTQPSPKVQVVEVQSKTAAALAPPTAAPNDDQIQRDMKSVLADTTIKTETQTQVNVKWEDKPFSPFFAAYNSDGTSGLGYTFHKTPALNLDALVFVGPTGQKRTEAGIGLEHIIKSTSAGVGVDTTYDFTNKHERFGVYAAVHF